MPFPSPSDYSDWPDFAQALIQALESGNFDASAGSVDGSTITGTIDAGQIEGTLDPTTIPPPDSDALPVYWSPSLQELFLADDFFVPPPVITPFLVDTQSLALASVDLNRLADNSVSTFKLQTGAVTDTKIASLAVTTAKIYDAAILTAKIADANILSAKIADLQVITAKINDLAVTTAKINSLAVGTAQIGDAAITTAKIGSAQVGTAQIGTAVITQALMADASIGSAQIINASIATADIGAAQIVTALVGLAQITNALIASAAIGTANIQNAAITNALIADATIASAKIASLVIDKVTAGTLNAVIDMGTGLIRFTIGGNKLVLGKGFGTANQFIMWFGPSMAESAMSEATAVFYLKTNGSAYFGGTLSAGVIKNSVQTTSQIVPNTLETGVFLSNGNPIQVVVSYSWLHTYRCDPGTGSITGSGSATVIAEKSTNSGGTWTSLGSNVTISEGTREVIVDGDPGIDDQVRWSMGGSSTYNWTPGALTTLDARARLTVRNEPTFGGTGINTVVIQSSLTLVTTEQ